LEKALELQNEIGDNEGLARALNNLGAIHSDRQEYEEARASFEKSLELTRGLKVDPLLGRELVNMVIENMVRVQFRTNRLIDDLFDYVKDKKTIEEVPVLKGWRTIREGHRTASEGKWAKANELVVQGERLLKALGGVKSSGYAWRHSMEAEGNVG
jgi:tetratricopeptide (TPR) repeat protein